MASIYFSKRLFVYKNVKYTYPEPGCMIQHKGLVGEPFDENNVNSGLAYPGATLKKIESNAQMQVYLCEPLHGVDR